MHYKISLDTPLFSMLKSGMDECIARALHQMKVVGGDEATITAKLQISKAKTIDTLTGLEYEQPQFEHKVSFSVPIKGQIEGRVQGTYALEEDEDGQWLVRDRDRQTRMDI